MDRASERAIRSITVAHGALEQLPAILAAVGAEPPVLLVADPNTYKAAGQRAGSLLTLSGVDVKSYILERTHTLAADEEALAEVCSSCLSPSLVLRLTQIVPVFTNDSGSCRPSWLGPLG